MRICSIDAIPSDSDGDITKILNDFRDGSPDAENRLIAMVYRDLRSMAAQLMRRERRDHTLQASALVNETYLRLFSGAGVNCTDRHHFFRIAAGVMRHVLVDHAKHRRTIKRGGGAMLVSLEDFMHITTSRIDEVLAVDEALEKLANEDERACKVVELRIFTGLGIDEIAQILDIAPRTVKRDWEYARAWLKAELSSSDSDVASSTGSD